MTAARHVVVVVLRELWPLLVIATGVSVILASVAESDWKEIFLFNGDSITLPLVLQSLQRGEPFEWVFSTQTFFFPEFPIYWLCSLVGGSPQASLLLNAYVNVFILYGLLRGMAAIFLPGRPLRQIAIALGAVVVLLAAIVSDRSAPIMYPGVVGVSNIPTLFLLTTYYYGVIVLGVAGVLFALVSTRGFVRGGLSRRRASVYLAGNVTVGAATMYSNPLYAAMFVLPLIVVLTILLVLRRLPWRWYVVLVGAQVATIIIGMVLRSIFWRFIADSDFKQYLNPQRVWDAFGTVLMVLSDWTETGWGVVRLLALFVPLGATLAYLIVAEVRRRRGHPPITTTRLFVLLFVVVSAVSLVAGHILTGQLLTRYLVPTFVFPLMGLVVVVAALTERSKLTRLGASARRAITLGIASTGVIAALLLGAVTVPPIIAMGQEAYPRMSCFDDWLDGRDINGVATFMTIRPLELYGHHEGRLVQVSDTVVPNGWMTNLWYYTDTEFSFVMTTVESEFDSAIAHLGAPAEIVTCPGFQILDYAGTDGLTTLNDTLHINLVNVVDGRKY